MTDTRTNSGSAGKNVVVGLVGAAAIAAAFGYWTLTGGPAPDLRDLAFAAGVELPGDGMTYRLRHETNHVLRLPTGRAAIVNPTDGAFYAVDADVAPGSYPVLLTIAEQWQPDAATQQDERLAFATVRFQDGNPARWMPGAIPALGGTTNAPTLIPLGGDSPALADAGCESAFAGKDGESFWNQVLTQYADTLTYQWTSALASLDNTNGCTVLLLYTASTPATPYLGLAPNGTILCLTLDFNVLPNP